MRDLCYAFRSLARTPAFSVTAILILSLSVGATTAVFTLLHALVLRPLPIKDPHELARVLTVDWRGSEADLPWRLHREFLAHQTIFSAVIPSLDQSVLTLESDRGVERGAVAGTAGNFFQEFGTAPALGRLIQPSDVDFMAPSAAPVAVLGWGFWQRHYGGDTSVIGRTIKIDGVPLEIIGVVQKDFKGFSVTIEHDVMVPIALLPSIMQSAATMFHGTSRWVGTIGRLAPGVTVESARTQVEAMWPALLTAAMPEQFLTTPRVDYLKWTSRVVPAATGIERGLRNSYTNPLYALLGIAALVLVIAGANLCALVFARAESRRQGLAVRLALGSSRLRVIRELCAEGALLGVAGAIGGVVFAALASDAIFQLLVREYTVNTSLDTSPDAAVLAVAIVASVGVAVAVTLAAAVSATRQHGRLVPGGSRTVARSSRAGQILVGAQVAASIVMLAHASLLARSLYGLTTIDTGLTGDTVIIGYTYPLLNGYKNLDVATSYRQSLDRVRAVPGVTAAAFSTFKPDGGNLPRDIVGRANTPRTETDLQAEWPQVSPGFFETLGIPLLRGRDFTYADGEKTQKVAIISATLERQLFGEGLGVGQRMRVSSRAEWQDVEVVGVIGDARVFGLRSDNRATIYTAAVQSGPASHWKCLVVRAPQSTVPQLRQAIESFGVEMMRRTQTLAYARGRAILQERLLAGLSGYFAVLALLLVSAGIYGLLSYVLSLRRKEIGIRMALGADAALMTRSILRDGLVVSGAGIVTGLAAAIATVPLIRRLLVNTSPYDPAAIGLACAVLLIVTGAASLLPALRAGRVEPLAELRRE
ncbi:MAG: ADOP family duplicated permease [Cyanobacteria bacterium]|nr:ADOP family duplicated permease [Cyanobacteriota bacterium]